VFTSMRSSTMKRTFPGLVGLLTQRSAGCGPSPSRPVVHRAEEIARKILDTYLEPDMSFVELRENGRSTARSICCTPLATACHDEFEQMMRF